MIRRAPSLLPVVVATLLTGMPREASAAGPYYNYPQPRVYVPRSTGATRANTPTTRPKTAPIPVDPLQQLWAAFLRGDVKTVQMVLSAHRNLVNARSPDGTPLLTLAIYSRRLAMITAVTNNGPDVNLAGPGGIAPLHAAVWVRDREAVNLLLGRGANIEGKTLDGDTPLFYAAYPDLEARWATIVTTKKVRKDTSVKSNSEFVSLLLANKASLTAVNRRGLTPLDFSLTTGNIEAFDTLKAAGAKEDASITFFDNVAHKDLNAVKAALSKNPNLATSTMGGDTSALHVACLFDSVDIAKLLIDKGASVNATTRNGTTPLHSAMWGNDKALSDLLISKGANPNAVDASGDTPLVAALRVGSEDVLYGLLAKGADPNKIDRNNLAPLMVAINMKRFEAATILVEKGARVRGDLGRVAMFAAEAAGDKDFMSALIDNGADVNAVNAKGNTVTYQATLDNKIELVALLKQHGGKV